ncbi:MAG: divalent-cation tolerance protein CutA [Planctomycetes bacterium]|jgi:periplasmic divalent cation tolerance protein|nr:divalent-cation tolerance protein CutA [Planctomycetota bacterium]HJM57574.1 divalent-cation tolerance protein CutA [Planctomycetota bacterium]
MDSVSPLLVVLVTVPDEGVADSLSKALVGERLAACAQVLPGLTSHYSWEGQLERSEEVLVILKAPEERLADLEQRVRQLHPYDVPQIVALPASHVEEHYARWVEKVTGTTHEGDTG